MLLCQVNWLNFFLVDSDIYDPLIYPSNMIPGSMLPSSTPNTESTAIWMDSQTKGRMTEICAQLGMTPSAAFNIFTNAFVRAISMPFAVKLDVPSPTVTRSQMLADADDILSDFAKDYKRMSE